MGFEENLKKMLDEGQILDGLWISPLGEIRVAHEHGPDIQKEPAFFDLTRGDVAGVSLGDLRKIATDLIQHGWVRYRYLSNRWLFEVHSVKMKIGILEEILVQLKAYPHEEVIVEQSSPKRTYRGTVAQFYARAMFSQHHGPGGATTWRMSDR